MSSIKTVDEIIQAAMDRGEFNDLPGKGKPVDLTDYFNSPEESRLAISMLKNAGVLPEELESLKEIELLKTQIDLSKDADQKKQLQKKLNELTLSFNLMMEKYKQG